MNVRKDIFKIVLLVVVCSSFSAILYYKEKGSYCQQALENMINEQNTFMDKRNVSESSDQIASLYNTGLMLDPHLLLTCVDGEKQELGSLPEPGRRLVLYFSMQNCLQCVKYMLPVLKQLTEETGAEKVICMINSHSRREVSLFNRDNGLDGLVFIVDSLGLPLEKENLPFFFVIDENLKTNYVYIPRGEMTEQTAAYLKLMKHVLLNRSSE